MSISVELTRVAPGGETTTWKRRPRGDWITPVPNLPLGGTIQCGRHACSLRRTRAGHSGRAAPRCGARATRIRILTPDSLLSYPNTSEDQAS